MSSVDSPLITAQSQGLTDDENPLLPIETIALHCGLAALLDPQCSWHTAFFSQVICKPSYCWRPSIFTEYTVGL